jgi:uncharacterized protein (TIGR01777 family)
VQPVGRVPALDPCDAVVHLAGEPVAQRWTPEAKQKIRHSRIAGTAGLLRAIAKLPERPRVLISASAIGYYGDRGEESLTESSAPGSGFLAEICRDWEKAAQEAELLGLRVVRIRFGIILGPNGGALAKMLPIFRSGLGGSIAGGRQWMSWIHLEDVIRLIVHAIQAERLSGAMNATAPNPVRNAEFTKVLAWALHRPAIIPVPGAALRLLYGEMGTMLTTGQLVQPAAALGSGFSFRFPELPPALVHILQHE